MNKVRSDLVLSGFSSQAAEPTQQIAILQHALDVDAQTAASYVQSMPCVVLEAAEEDKAYAVLDSLAQMGAEVSIKANFGGPPRRKKPVSIRKPGDDFTLLDELERDLEEGAPRVTGQGTPQPAYIPPVREPVRPAREPSRQQAPKVHVPKPPSEGELAAAWREAPPSFFGSLGLAFRTPLIGSGLSWLLFLGMASFFSVFVLVIARFMGLIGLVVQIVICTSLMALFARFFLATLASVVEGRETGPLPHMSDIWSQFVLPGMILIAWVASAYFPMFLWLGFVGGGNPEGVEWIPFWLLYILPFCVWPVALLQMTSGSIARMWDPFASMRSITVAPIKYLLVVCLGFVAVLLPICLAYVFIGVFQRSWLMSILSFFLLMLPVAYYHGVMGAMMGALIREHPEILPEEARSS